MNNRTDILGNIQKIVVKVGTSTLTDQQGKLNLAKIQNIVKELSHLTDKGYDVALVTSGAVGAGMGLLNMSERPKDLTEKRMLSAVGQLSLMNIYQTFFKEHHKIIGQLLLTKADFSDRQRYLNMRNVCHAFLDKKIIPIINENDAVVSDALALKVGDNDTMSALVAGLIDADLLIILSDIDGLYDKNPSQNIDAKLIELVEKIDDNIKKMAGGEGSKFGTGGMITKINAAQMATKIGTNLVIINGENPNNITKVVEGQNIGTLFAKKHHKISSKKYWLAYGTYKEGLISIDKGAEQALLSGKSLLPIGIKSVEGDFEQGTVLQIENADGDIIASGISNYSSEEINQIKGRHSHEIEEILGHKYDNVVIHIDNMVLV